jgi:phosphoglycolate phosphatase
VAAILLDWDGLLIDSISLYFELYKEACRRHGKVLPVSTLEEFRGWYNPNWEQNYWEMGFSPEEFAEVQKFSQEFLRYESARLFPGVPEMLTRLARRGKLAIVSTTPSFLIRRRLAQEDLEGLFLQVTGGEDGKSEKVDKIGQTLKSLGETRGVMAGDTALDIESARHHGLATVGATYGWSLPEKVRRARPDRLVEDPADLEPAITDLLDALEAAGQRR